MPSFYRALCNLFRANPAARRKPSHDRPASFEVLEKRNLLAGDLPAALTGSVVVDRTDDGLSNDDTALAGAVVQLYRDGGDGVFDGGQGDDAPLGSQTTDTEGQYRFDGLTPATYFVQQLPASGLLQRESATVQQVEISAADMAGEIRTPIDTFETLQYLTVSAFGGTTASSSVVAPEAIGGERDQFLEITSGVGDMTLNAGNAPENLTFSSSAGADGVRVVTWDGNDEVSDTTNYRGLNGYDLTENGTVSGIAMLHGADLPFGRVILRVYTDQNNWSQGIIDIAQTDSRATAPGLILLEDFTVGGGGGADFTDVGAIELEIEARPALDGQLSRIDTYGPKILTADFVNLQPLSLGNLVWFDAENDGTYSGATEQGIGQVSVNLYSDTDGDGEFSGADTLLANQQTSADGTYRFDNLLPGDYLVHLASSNFAPGGALEGLVLTSGGAAADPDNDIDNDNNGLLTVGGATATTAVTLASLAEPVGDGDGNANTNLTVDIGLTLFDLSITKTDSPDPAIAGELLTYTLEVTNHGPADAADVLVLDDLPDGLSNPQVVSSQGTANEDGNAIAAALGSLPVGATATVTIVADIDAGFTGRLDNLAVVSGRRNTAQPVPNDPWREVNLTNNQDMVSTDIVAETDLTITKTDNPDPVVPGEELTYTLQVTNNGPSTATGVVVDDVLPDGVVFKSVSATQGNAVHEDGRIAANLGTLQPGESATVTIIVLVEPTQTEPIDNVANVEGDQSETNTENNLDDETTNVTPLIDLVIDKSDDPDAVVAGQQLTYTLLVTNNGPSVATGVVATDALPDGVSFVSANASQGTAQQAAGTVTADLGTLAAGASATVTIVGDVDPAQTVTLLNVATVVGNEEETNLDNNRDEEPTEVSPLIDLVIDKSDDPDAVVAGQQLTYTLVVTNNGPSVATGVVATDVLPDGVSFVSANASQGTAQQAAGTVTADLGTLAAGASATVTIVGDVDPAQTVTLLNVATVVGNEAEANLDNNRAEEPTEVSPLIDLVIDKSDDPDAVVAGQQLTYTLVVTNNGPSVATGVVATDALPDGVSFVSANASQGTAQQAAGTVTADLGTLAAGASATVTIVGDVDPAQAVTLLNVATVVGNEAETNLDNNRAEEPTEVSPLIDLVIDKSDDPDAVVAGQQLTYTLVVTNNGPSVATGVVTTDVLPDGVSFVSANASQGTAQHAAGTVTADLGTLAVGASATVTIVGDVDPAQTVTLLNVATVVGNEAETNLDNNRDEEPTEVSPLIDLVIDKSDDPDAVVAGQQLTYTLVVTNNGPSVATGVVTTDVLPDGVSFVSANASQGTAQHAAGTVTADLGTLAAGASATVTIVGDVDPAQTVTLLNVATVVGNEEETNLDNNRDEEPTEVSPLIDLVIDKSDDPDAVVAGQELTYTLVVTNNGPSVATGVVTTDVLPDGVSFVSANASQGTAQHAAGTVTADLGTLAVGASATVTIVGDVDPAQTVTLLNVATVVGNEEETNLDNNRDEEPTAVQSSVDLVIDKVDQPDPVIAGQQLTYTLHVTNQGPSTATGVTVTDQLPGAVQLQSASSSQGVVTESGGIVTVDLGTLAPGTSAEVTLLTDVDSGAPATLINSAAVTSDQPDANSDDNSDEEPTAVRGLFDLEVVKTDSADPIMAGEELTYTIVVSNNGPSDATDVVMIDDLPNEVTFVSAETTQGTVAETNGRVRAELGYLANGQSETVTILVTVGFDVVEEIENVAIVDGNPVQTNPLSPGTVIKESNLDNNFDEEPTIVQASLASISGYVYVDLNNDGQRGLSELPIPGVEVQLTGTDVLGNSVSRLDVTDSDGAYAFLDLLPGSYTVTEVQPSLFQDGKDTPGTVAGGTGLLQYSVNDDVFAGIGLAGGVDAVEFNFGELMHTFSKRDYLASSPATPHA